MAEETDLTPSQDGEAGSGGCDRGDRKDGSYKVSIEHRSEDEYLKIISRGLDPDDVRKMLRNTKRKRSFLASIRRCLVVLGGTVRTVFALVHMVRWMK